jgi:hypothetical protein
LALDVPLRDEAHLVLEDISGGITLHLEDPLEANGFLPLWWVDKYPCAIALN